MSSVLAAPLPVIDAQPEIGITQAPALVRASWVTVADDVVSGYGKVGKYLGAALCEHGLVMVPYRATDWDVRIAVGGPRAWALGRGAGPIEDWPVIPDILWHTMFEADPLPPDWPPLLNRCGAVWVPSVWVKELFERGGVTAPIFVSGYGVDPTEFEVTETATLPADRPYTFLWCGTAIGDGKTVGDRKGSWEVILAFLRLGLRDARLVLKATDATAASRIVGPGSDHIQIITQKLSASQYAALLAQADCFVYPSKGEGFGLQLLEAMAAGLAVIAPQQSGMAEYISDGVALPLPVGPVEHAVQMERFYGHTCTWPAYSVDDIAERMQWCYEHRDEAAAIGKRARAYVLDGWTWDKAGQRGMAVIRQALKESIR